MCTSHVGALCAVLLNGAHLFSASISRMCCRVHPATCPCPRWGGSIFYRWRNFWPTAAPREAGVLCPVRWNSAVSEGESTTSAWRVGQRRIPQPNCCHVLLGCGSKAKGTQARGKSTSFAFEKGFYNNNNKSQTQEEGHSVGGGKPPRHANGNVICYIFITKPKKHGQERKSQISPQRRRHASPLTLARQSGGSQCAGRKSVRRGLWGGECWASRRTNVCKLIARS